MCVVNRFFGLSKIISFAVQEGLRWTRVFEQDLGGIK